ncbi:phage virion morphogenesis protein [Neptunicella sp. SCSIO 80796]|uniref:phage virion morphogenesis protein n=1 Tax=Neptunicella plasticusilytica TaxID=3117012 RepID=UPI003A4DDAE3
MAGSFIQVIPADLTKINKALNGLIQKTNNLEPALREIGEYLLEAHQERFKLEVAPDGELWDPLSPKTIKRKGNDDILQDSGTLRDLLHYQITGNTLEFGTNLEYGATHQFGREDDGIPQREFLGIGSNPWNDTDHILNILQDHLQNAVTV